MVRPNVTFREIQIALHSGGPLHIVEKDTEMISPERAKELGIEVAAQKQVHNAYLSIRYTRSNSPEDMREQFDLHVFGKINGFEVLFVDGQVTGWKPSVPLRRRMRSPEKLSDFQRETALEVLGAVRRCLEFA